MSIPREIEGGYVYMAARHIDAERRDGTFPPMRASRGVHVVIDGERYPPKYIISLAAYYARGKEHPASAFITTEAVSFLRRLGFKVVWD